MSDPGILPKLRDVRTLLCTHPSKQYAVRKPTDITQIAIHHSLTENGSAESFARYHVQHNGWPGIGYHFVIEKTGAIKWCNDLTRHSYHVQGHNKHSIGVCMVGDFRNGQPTAGQYLSLQKLVNWLRQEYSIPSDKVLGHSEFQGNTDRQCPCIDMDQLRKSIKKPIASVSPNPYDSNDDLPISNGISLKWILNTMSQLGFTVFKKDHLPYNINIVGIRTKTRQVNAFDDFIAVFYKYQGKWSFNAYKATTDPGLYYLLHPMNVNGTAILKAGQYRGAYQLGIHKNYLALVQRKAVTVIRDGDRNGQLDFTGGKEQTGIFGIDIHRSSPTGESTLVDKWSAGCQVFANINDFNAFIALCKRAREHWGETFSYTLIDA